jgi:hypothetical protein
VSPAKSPENNLNQQLQQNLSKVSEKPWIDIRQGLVANGINLSSQSSAQNPLEI